MQQLVVPQLVPLVDQLYEDPHPPMADCLMLALAESGLSRCGGDSRTPDFELVGMQPCTLTFRLRGVQRQQMGQNVNSRGGLHLLAYQLKIMCGYGQGAIHVGNPMLSCV